jgi:hypothetical protein
MADTDESQSSTPSDRQSFHYGIFLGGVHKSESFLTRWFQENEATVSVPICRDVCIFHSHISFVAFVHRNLSTK